MLNMLGKIKKIKHKHRENKHAHDFDVIGNDDDRKEAAAKVITKWTKNRLAKLKAKQHIAGREDLNRNNLKNHSKYDVDKSKLNDSKLNSSK